MSRRLRLRIRLASLLVMSAFATTAAAPAVAPGVTGSAGYAGMPLPDLRRLLPPPPSYGTADAWRDAQLFLQTRETEKTDPALWAEVRHDADDRPSSLLARFACALGRPAAASDATLLRLVARSSAFVASALTPPRPVFRRSRPYRYNHQPICVARFTPLDRSNSYPSIPAAEALTTALILGELAPDRLGPLVERARLSGESLAVCGVNWESDVTAGEAAAAGLVALLHANADFRRDLEAAHDALVALTRQDVGRSVGCGRGR